MSSYIIQPPNITPERKPYNFPSKFQLSNVPSQDVNATKKTWLSLTCKRAQPSPDPWKIKVVGTFSVYSCCKTKRLLLVARSTCVVPQLACGSLLSTVKVISKSPATVCSENLAKAVKPTTVSYNQQIKFNSGWIHTKVLYKMSLLVITALAH